jgi:DnaJ-class molecular chaperone
MQFKNYYQILNVNRDASAEDIKRTFRRLAMQYHPDRNPEGVREAGEKFKEINEAYEVLGDEQRRWQYDRLVNPSSNLRNTMHVEDIFTDEKDADSIMEMFQKLTSMGFVVGRTGWRKSWDCGRRRGGGQCRRQYRQEY